MAPTIKSSFKMTKVMSWPINTFTWSDHFIGRNISCLIKLSWTEEAVKDRAGKMINVIKKVL